ncbi:MAG: type II secretion system protein [Planctomycetota bacterium]|jgi:type II secretory pathway pseudopilin PulG
MTKRRGFSIVELLVVAAIMMTLAMMLMPTLTRFKEQGKQKVCISNLRNLQMAMIGYVSENDDVFPPHRNTDEISDENSDEDDSSRWWGRDTYAREMGEQPECEIFPYAGEDEKVFQCPVLKAPESPASGLVLEWSFTPKNVGYGYNAFFLGQGSFGSATAANGVTPDRWCRLSYVEDASRTILLADSTIRSGSGHESGSYAMWWDTATRTNNTGAYARHLDRANLMMVDGVVRDKNIEDIHENSAGGYPRLWNPRAE